MITDSAGAADSELVDPLFNFKYELAARSGQADHARTVGSMSNRQEEQKNE